MPDETSRDRRLAVAFLQRMGAAWSDRRAVVEAHHAAVGNDTVVSLGPSLAFDVADRRQALANVERHGSQADDGNGTVVVFGPSLEIPFNRG